MNPTASSCRRLLPDEPFPPYSFVPGQYPHPVSDPRGHRHGQEPERVEAVDPDLWQGCRPYLYALDLFNHGYYWEAHETWEGLWHACGRKGLTADFLKGLIKLAAAGVKVRERGGIRRGILSHAQGAAELFRRTAERLGDAAARYLGLRVSDLLTYAQQVEASAAGNALRGVSDGDRNATEGVPCRFPFVLVPVPWPADAET